MANPDKVRSIVEKFPADSLRRALSSRIRESAQVPYAPDYLGENLRLNRQRYAESAFNDRAKSPAGATGAYQIMPITQKDYLSRGKGTAGDLLDPNYNRQVRDFALDIVQRDLGDTWSDDDSEEVRLAKRYAGYNWGAGSLKRYLRKQRNAGVDISNSLDWMSGLPKETKDYVDFIVLGNDVPGTSKTMDAYRRAWEKYSSEPFPEDSIPAVQRDWTFAAGGNLYWPGGYIGHTNPSVIRRSVKRVVQNLLPSKVAKGLAGIAGQSHGMLSSPKDVVRYYQYGVEDDWEPASGFLMHPKNQRKYLESIGYKAVDDGNYGMVNRAVSELSSILGEEIPIYQLGDDEIDPDKVELISTDQKYINTLFDRMPQNKMLRNAGSYPVAIYKDKNSDDLYMKSWDLNDYGQHKPLYKVKKKDRSDNATTYGARQFLAELYDRIGTPFVQRTGLIKLLDEPPESKIAGYSTLEFPTAEFHGAGGKIHIKPENRGKFTALKKRTGHSASWFKAHGTPAQKKMAVFALNSRKWRHGDGGLIERMQSVYGDDIAAMREAIQLAKSKK